MKQDAGSQSNAEKAFGDEIQAIISLIVQEVNKESSRTVTEALKPTRESHNNLLQASTQALSLLESTKKVSETLSRHEKSHQTFVQSNNELKSKLSDFLENFNTPLDAMEHRLSLQFQQEIEKTQGLIKNALTIMILGGVGLFVFIAANI